MGVKEKEEKKICCICKVVLLYVWSSSLYLSHGIASHASRSLTPVLQKGPPKNLVQRSCSFSVANSDYVRISLHQ